MGIGASVALIAIGAILTFAVNARIGVVDIEVVGWILMAAGVIGLIFTTLIWGRRGTRVVTREPGTRRTVEDDIDLGPDDRL